jgi:hypothetical protein
MRYLAYYMYFNYILGRDISEYDLALLENELNENYACEYLHFSIYTVENRVRLAVSDLYAGRVIAESED